MAKQRDRLQARLAQMDLQVDQLRYDLAESKARESKDAAIEFYRTEKEKICREIDEKLKQSERSFHTLLNEHERQCRDLACYQKIKEDALDKCKWQENQIDKSDERIEQLERDKEETVVLYNLEESRAIEFKEAYYGLVKKLREHKYEGC